MAKVLKMGDRGDAVTQLQEALIKSGVKSKLKKADGKFDSTTEEALKTFQGENRLDPDGLAGRKTMDKLSKFGGGKDSKEGNGKSGEENIKGMDILKGVDKSLQEKVIQFAEKYGPITIKSGVRDLQEQAALMVDMSDSDLDMYDPKKLGNYVDEIKQLEKKDRTATKVKEILAKWQKKGSRISWHIKGRAIDISAKGSFNWTEANKIAKEVGLKVKNEEGRNCFHVQLD